jgi:hypothetical protein
MLNDDGHARFDQGRVGRIARNALRLDEIVEAQMQRAARAQRESIRSRRFPILEKDQDGDVGMLVREIEQARRFMRHEGAVG